MVAKTRGLDYELHKQTMAARSRARSMLGRDIGDIPPITDVKLRRECDRRFRTFLEAMFPNRFPIPWSKNHLKFIELCEDTVITSGRLAVAMPRGEGKTTIAECAGLWATMTARHRYIKLIGSSKPKADGIIESIKSELSHNDRLLATYPAICFPFRALQGESRRASGQLHHGERTQIDWKDDVVQFAIIRGEPASGALIETIGLEGDIRGSRMQLPDGRSFRPTLVIVDDPQTDDSAWSESQCAKRQRVIEGAVAGLASSQQRTGIIMPCTVIRRGDLADTLLDRSKNPEWRGIRTRMVESFPTNDELWQKYAELRERSLLELEDISLATEFYRKNRKAMDAGAVVAWPERYIPSIELSAIQHAMNLKLRNEAAFWAEYQNEPLDDSIGDGVQLTADAVSRRLNGLGRRIVPADAEILTAFIDVQGDLLFYLVAAWTDRFDGWVVDYGTFPDQKGRRHYTNRDAKQRLSGAFPGTGEEGRIYAGLQALTGTLCGAEWTREDGAPMRLDLCVVDSGHLPDVVFKACRASPHAAVLMPSKGWGINAAARPMEDRKKGRGERMGVGWFIAAGKNRGMRSLNIDTNRWKSFVASRLRVALGDPAALTLYGSKPEDHKLLAEHLTSEYAVLTEGRGRKVEEWKVRPGSNGENHLWDCLIGAAVAASVRGAALPEQEQPRSVKRRRISQAEARSA